ncbi:MAG: serine protease [Pseudomonadales bacterium]
MNRGKDDLFVKHIIGLAAIVNLALSAMFSHSVDAETLNQFFSKHAVRVETRSSDARDVKVASGFLYGDEGHVVTSLHAVPRGWRIFVKCGGVTKEAKPVRAFKDADLILLETMPEPNGFNGTCEPLGYDQSVDPPGETSKLRAFGWHNGALSGTKTDEFERHGVGEGQSETIAHLVAGTPLENIKAIGVPATDLAIYKVGKGILPGHSGAAVVNQERKLIGIADGGLNSGASGYNWVIPALNLPKLMRSDPIEESPFDKLAGVNHFASGLVSSGKKTELEYRTIKGESFRWILNKTLPLSVLAGTSDDPDGVLALLQTFGAFAGNPTAAELYFDLYEESSHNLILAVPAGQGLKYGEVQGNPGYYLLASDSESGAGIQYKKTDWSIIKSLDPNVHVSPNNSAFFQELTADLISSCNVPGKRSCELFEPVLRTIDFGDNRKILKLGLLSQYAQSKSFKLDYYSYAIAGADLAFRAWAEIVPANPESGLLQCMLEIPSGCNSPQRAREELTQLLAVHLTTFANLRNGTSERVVEESFDYDASADSPDTIRTGFFVGETMLFYNSRGKVWDWNVSEQRTNLVGEYKREAGYVFLEDGEEQFKIPIQGGDYFRSTDKLAWNYAGSLEPRR